MSTESTVEAVVDRLQELPAEQQREVLDFAEFLSRKQRPRRSLWEIIEARIADIPKEVLEELPADASKNLDHYLYGAPKKRSSRPKGGKRTSSAPSTIQ